jgi:hypothetical protein
MCVDRLFVRISVIHCHTTVTDMKTTTAFSLALCAPLVAAFPRAMYEIAAEMGEAKRQAGGPQGGAPLPLVPPPFDAEAQYVSNQGAHAYLAPGPGDARGPCPGLNALANHNYLPHNGVATIQQFIDATNAGFGMADVSTSCAQCLAFAKMC